MFFSNFFKMNVNKNTYIFAFVLSFIVVCFIQAALAEQGGTGTLPWEDWLTSLRKSVSGPVAYAVAIIGIAGSAITFIVTGAEVGGFFKLFLGIVFGMSILVGVNALVETFFGASAQVPESISLEQIMQIRDVVSRDVVSFSLKY